MGALGKGKELLSAQVQSELYDYIGERGARLDGRSRAWVAQRIIEFWLRCGAPPLSELDAKLEPLPIPVGIIPKGADLMLAEAKALYGEAKKKKKP